MLVKPNWLVIINFFLFKSCFQVCDFSHRGLLIIVKFALELLTKALFIFRYDFEKQKYSSSEFPSFGWLIRSSISSAFLASSSCKFWFSDPNFTSSWSFPSIACFSSLSSWSLFWIAVSNSAILSFSTLKQKKENRFIYGHTTENVTACLLFPETHWSICLRLLVIELEFQLTPVFYPAKIALIQ